MSDLQAPTDQSTNPYASPKETGVGARPETAKPSGSGEFLEPLSPLCRTVFTLDLIGCGIRAIWLIVALLMLTQLQVQSRAVPFVMAWLGCSSFVVISGIIADVMLLYELPAGRWWGWLSVLGTPAGYFFLFSVEGDILPLSVIPRLASGIIFLVMYIMALIECAPRKRSNEPPYRWSDFN